MKKIKVLYWSIVSLVFLNIVINSIFAGNHLYEFFKLNISIEQRENALAAAAGSIGFVFVMVWMLLAPLKRRALLVIATVPMMVGNILHSFLFLQTNPDSLAKVFSNFAFGFIYVGIHIFVYAMATKNLSRLEQFKRTTV